MKKILLILTVFSFCISSTFVSAAEQKKDVIYSVEDGVKLECNAKRVRGSIDDYIDITDYYYFKDGKIYSPNLVKLYGKINDDPRKVLKLKITDSEIKFKDRFYETWTMDYKWVTIDRKTGEYRFSAKRDFGTWYRTANAIGQCKIIEE